MGTCDIAGVVSQHLWTNHDHTAESMQTPEHMLWNQLEILYKQRNEWFPIQQFGAKTQDFMELLKNQLASASQARRISKGLFTEEDAAPIFEASAPLQIEDLTSQKTSGEREIFDHEEKMSQPSLEESDDNAQVSQDPCDAGDITPVDGEQRSHFQHVRPDDGDKEWQMLPPELKDEVFQTSAPAIAIWNATGAIPAFQTESKLKQETQWRPP